MKYYKNPFHIFTVKKIVFGVLFFSILFIQTAQTQDTDGDSVNNDIDLDDDNDGIPDEIENKECALFSEDLIRAHTQVMNYL